MGDTTYRLWGIDAPELDQRCYPDGWRAGIAAARALAAMVERWPVTCEARSLDSHGRTVALCRAAGEISARRWSSAAWRWRRPATAADYVELEARANGRARGHACPRPASRPRSGGQQRGVAH
jgi:endonuclease YncB( thermonuclease family)